MTIHTHAIYKAGVIHLDQPLAIPDDAAVDLTIVLSVGASDVVASASDGPAMAAALQRLAAAAPIDADDPAQWQRAQSADRTLPGREV